MIKFTKSTAEGMKTFRDAIRQQIIEMAAEVISPIYGDWESFDEEIAHKLDTDEIEYSEAEKIFAERFYESDLNNMMITNKSVVFYDHFNVEDTQNFGDYELDEMVKKLRKMYPDIEVFGTGYIDYHFAAINYILIAYGNKIVFSNDEETGGAWINIIARLSSGWKIKEILEEYDEFSTEKLRKDIKRFISKHGLKMTEKELLKKIGLDDSVLD